MTEGRQPVLEAEGLRFSYRGRPVLEGLDVRVTAGECVGLLGPNGSGKSTFLRVVSGMLPVGGGRLVFRGRELARGGSRGLLSELGMVFQEPSLDGALTAEENLSLAGQMYGLGRAERRARAARLLEAVGLLERSREPVRKLSGGMRRRVDLARALLHEPSLLLMDEPTTGLDEGAFRGFWEQLERLRGERELSVVVATHRAEEAERCDRVAILSGGVVAACDSPQALRASLSADVVVLEGEDAEGLARDVEEDFGVGVWAEGEHVWVTCERGHALIPRLVERYGEGRLRSVSLRRPGLGDVFLKVTGASLSGEERG